MVLEDRAVEPLGKYMMLAAVGLFAVGALVWAAGHFGFRGLPGDIAVEGRGWKVYFPIVSSIVVSVVLTIVLNLLARWGR